MRSRSLATRSVLIVLLTGVLAACATLALGAARFSAIPKIASEAVMVESAARDFYVSLAVISAFFLALSSLAAWFSARAVSEDVAFVARRVRAIAKHGDLGEPIAIRSLDEVGAITRAFEGLRKSYVEQLARERAALKQAQDADRQKSEFLSTVSHELRTPLNAILGFSEVLLAEMEGPLNEGQREDIQMIRASGQHLAALFNNVLDFSAIASGHIRLTCAPIDVGEVLDEVKGVLSAQKTKAVSIHCDVPDDLPHLEADPTRFRQIVMNLATNALKFTKRGEVRLAARANEDSIAVMVIDTGIGIAERDLPLLFTQFSQLGTSDGRRGSGLGLSIVKELVERHGGQIRMQSQEGVGSTFTVILPQRRRNSLTEDSFVR